MADDPQVQDVDREAASQIRLFFAQRGMGPVLNTEMDEMSLILARHREQAVESMKSRYREVEQQRDQLAVSRPDRNRLLLDKAEMRAKIEDTRALLSEAMGLLGEEHKPDSPKHDARCWGCGNDWPCEMSQRIDALREKVEGGK